MNILKKNRERAGLKLQEMVAIAGIDQALISKYESGARQPSEKHLPKLAKAYQIPLIDLKKELYADKISKLIAYDTDILPSDIWVICEQRVEYLRSAKVFDRPKIDEKIQKKLDRADVLKEKWARKRPLSGVQLYKMQEYFNTKYTYDSNQIEGNTLSFRETDLVVNKGLTISNKSMREHLEAISHSHAIDFVKELITGQLDIDKKVVLDLHSLVLKSIEPMYAGKYRDTEVRIGGSQHIPPAAVDLPNLMNDYFINYTKQKKGLHPIILAAEMHERLVSIHPFIDGNGRTSRLVMNFILLKNGYTLCSLKGDYDSRMAYYDALEHIQLHNEPNLFYNLILDRLIESLEEHLKLV